MENLTYSKEDGLDVRSTMQSERDNYGVAVAPINQSSALLQSILADDEPAPTRSVSPGFFTSIIQAIARFFSAQPNTAARQDSEVLSRTRASSSASLASRTSTAVSELSNTSVQPHSSVAAAPEDAGFLAKLWRKVRGNSSGSSEAVASAAPKKHPKIRA